MEGQGVAASAASEAGRHGDPGVGAVAAADFDDPGVSHVTSDTSGGGEGQGRNGDDTLVMPALGRPEASGPGPAGPVGSPAGPAGSPAGPLRSAGSPPASQPPGSPPPQPSTPQPSAPQEPQPHLEEQQPQ